MVDSTELAKLIVRIEANQSTFEKQLKRIEVQTGKTVRSIDRQTARLSKKFDNIGRGFFRQILLSTTALTAALSVRQVVAYADAWKTASNEIAVALDGLVDTDQAMKDVFRAAQSTRTALSATARVYSTFSRSAEKLGLSQQDLADLTTTANKAAALTAPTAKAAAAGLEQFSQAINSGRLGGDEIRSVTENIPGLAQAIEDGLGIARGSLRKYAQSTEITAEKIVAALKKVEDQYAERFKKVEVTVTQALQVLENAFIEYIGTSDQIQSSTDLLTQAILHVANNFETIADSAAMAASILTAVLLSRALVPVGGALKGLTPLITRASSRFGVMGGAAAATRIGIRGLTASLGALVTLMGGPLGVALAAAATAFLLVKRAQEELEKPNRRLVDIKKELLSIERQLAGASVQNITLSRERAKALREEAEEQLRLAQANADSVGKKFVPFGPSGGGALIGNFFDKLIREGKASEELEAALAALEAINEEADELDISLGLESYAALTREVGELKGQLRNSSEAEARAIRDQITALQTRANLEAEILQSKLGQLTAQRDAARDALKPTGQFITDGPAAGFGNRAVPFPGIDLSEKNKALYDEYLRLNELVKQVEGTITKLADVRSAPEIIPVNEAGKAYEALNRSLQKRLESLRLESRLVNENAENSARLRAEHSAMAQIRDKTNKLTAQERRELEKLVPLIGDAAAEQVRLNAAKSFQGDIDRSKASTAEIRQELAALSLSTEEKARNRRQQELLDAAKKNGITITAQVRQQIDAEAAAYGRATAQLEKAKKQIESAKALFDGTRTPAENFVKTLKEIEDLQNSGALANLGGDETAIRGRIEALEELASETENVEETVERLQELVQQGLIPADRIDETIEKIEEAANKTNELAEDIASAFTDSFRQAAINGENIFDQLGNRLRAIILDALIFKPFENAVQGLINGVVSGFGGGGQNKSAQQVNALGAAAQKATSVISGSFLGSIFSAIGGLFTQKTASTAAAAQTTASTAAQTSATVAATAGLATMTASAASATASLASLTVAAQTASASLSAAGAAGAAGGAGGSGGLFSGGLKILGSLFGGGKSSGGDAFAGKFYEVNEEGRELFFPSRDTYVATAAQSRMLADVAEMVENLNVPAFGKSSGGNSVVVQGGDVHIYGKNTVTRDDVRAIIDEQTDTIVKSAEDAVLRRASKQQGYRL